MTNSTLELNVTAVMLNNLLDRWQPESDPVSLRGEQRFKYSIDHVGRHTRTVVNEAELYLPTDDGRFD